MVLWTIVSFTNIIGSITVWVNTKFFCFNNNNIIFAAHQDTGSATIHSLTVASQITLVPILFSQRGVIALNHNIDDQMGYGVAAWVLAGYFKTAVLTCDFTQTDDFQGLAIELTNALIQHK